MTRSTFMDAFKIVRDIEDMERNINTIDQALECIGMIPGSCRKITIDNQSILIPAEDLKTMLIMSKAHIEERIILKTKELEAL